MCVSLGFGGGETGRRTYVAILNDGVATSSKAERKFDGGHSLVVGWFQLMLGGGNGAMRVGPEMVPLGMQLKIRGFSSDICALH